MTFNMKKLLALLLLSPFVAGEEIKYPIELTCEIGAEILYININEDIKDRSLIFYKTNLVGTSLYGKSGTTAKIKNFKIIDNGISFTSYYKLQANQFFINSYNLMITQQPRVSTGQCYKGFKEYTEKQI